MFDSNTQLKVIVVGARGGLGEAVVQLLLEQFNVVKVWATSRQHLSFEDVRVQSIQMNLQDEASIASAAEEIRNDDVPNLLINCAGILHTESFGPEKTWRHLNFAVMQEVFQINAFAPVMLGKYFLPLFSRKDEGLFLSCSARVGSISDNQLGGWYSYRASKSAHNMFMKTLSLEARNRLAKCCIISYHPGTIDTELSKPFTRNYDPQKLFTPQAGAEYLWKVIQQVQVPDSGQFIAWDGQRIEF